MFVDRVSADIEIDGLAQSKVAEKISNDVPPDYAPALNVVYFPQLGKLSVLRMFILLTSIYRVPDLCAYA